MKTAILFPGQGSQAAGMGQDVFETCASSRDVYNRTDKALGFSLSSLCFKGPQDDLNLTANTQPALFATSAALATALYEHIVPEVHCVAGHSLGEYTALWFAGALDLETAVKLVRLRGESMQSATPQGLGAMAAVIGLDKSTILEICSDASGGEVLSAANFNAPGQTVISGHRQAVERAIEHARAKGSRKSILLPVSAPFHCPLMKPAADIMAEALDNVTIGELKHPVVCNVTADTIGSSDWAIRHALVEQITSPVLWEDSINKMIGDGVELFLEIGPGSVLTNLVKRINPSVQRFSISSMADIKNFIDFQANQT